MLMDMTTTAVQLIAEISGPANGPEDIDPAYVSDFLGEARGSFAALIAFVLTFFGDCVSAAHECLGDMEVEADYEALRFAAYGPRVEVIPVALTEVDPF